jgi:predicted glycoside hydrolase/deacetylase ChbG (UPF0249 family)
MERQREKLIISADDFGKNPQANQKILELAREGKINRVAVIADGIFSPAEIQSLFDCKIALDIHLTLPQKKQSAAKPGQAVFCRTFYFLSALIFGRTNPRQTALAWKSQIENFQNIFGRRPDGLNSHEYVHFFPPYFKIALQLCAQYEIPYLRFGASKLQTGRRATALILAALHKINFSRFQKSNLNSSAVLISLDWIADLEYFLENCGREKTEIVCHPEHPADFEAIKKYF